MKDRNAEPIPNSKSIIITAAICLFFLSATVLFGNYVQNLREAKTFTDLTNTKKKPASHDYVTASDGKRILEEYAELYNTNQDFIGWLEIEGTVINYPVMYTTMTRNTTLIEISMEKVLPMEPFLLTRIVLLIRLVTTSSFTATTSQTAPCSVVS